MGTTDGAEMIKGIFLLRGNELLETHEQQYESEAVLQELLERYPKLLVGEQIESSAARRRVITAWV
jgi:hypothetical protein